MVKQVDTTDLKSVAERRTGSTPVFPTKDTMKTLEEKANMILRALLGTDEAIQQWWGSKNRAFDGEIPDDLWHTDQGKLQVYNYLLDQMESPH